MRRIINYVMCLSVIVVMAAVVTLSSTVPVAADGLDVFKQACTDGSAANSELCKNNQTLIGGSNSIWQKIVNTLTFVIGAVAVIMIVIGGLKYVLSNGDQSQITSAKNTILYSVVGLVVAIMANAIVNFVIEVL